MLPVGQHEYRHTEEQDGKNLVFVVNRVTGNRSAVLPLEVEIVRTLLLGLDEGSIGMAGVAAAAFQQKQPFGLDSTRFTESFGT